MDDATIRFLTDLDRKISQHLGELLSCHFLFQWIIVPIQHLILPLSTKVQH